MTCPPRWTNTSSPAPASAGPVAGTGGLPPAAVAAEDRDVADASTPMDEHQIARAGVAGPDRRDGRADLGGGAGQCLAVQAIDVTDEAGTVEAGRRRATTYVRR